jgi:hypothetical protein
MPGIGKSGIARIKSCAFTTDGHSPVTKQDLRRLAIAVACAIALHEVAAMVFPRLPPARDSQETIAAHVTIARIVRTPRPTPSPTPKPTPTPPVKLLAPALVAAGTHARVERIKHVGAKRPTPPKAVMATPDASIPTGGNAAGAQNGAGTGSTSTVNGNGNGDANAGNGNGASICGAVDFESSESPVFNPQTGYWEHKNITAIVYYSDGTSEHIPLDWVWRYKNEADDPLRPGSDAPMLFQFPPVDQRANEPPAILYVIAHTTPGGRTRLMDCSNIPPPATPSPQP